MSEQVLVTAIPGHRSRFHTIDDGAPACGIGKKDNHEFVTVPRTDVAELGRCQNCSGEAQATGGQGGSMPAKLAAADPDEVSIR